MNLNTHAIVPGQISAADLAAARKHSTGRVLHLHRAVVCPPCHGMCNQGRNCNADSCAPEGGQWAEPVSAMESMWRFRRVAAHIKWGAALAALLAVVGYVARVIWPLA